MPPLLLDDSDDDLVYIPPCVELTPDNYWRWEHEIECRLGHYELSDLIDPEITPPSPTDTAAWNAWSMQNRTAITTIVLTLSSDTRDGLPQKFYPLFSYDNNSDEVKTARELMDHLKEKYSVLSSWRKYELHRELWHTRLEEENPMKGINVMINAFYILKMYDNSLDDSQLAMAIAIALPFSYRHIEFASHGPPEWSSSRVTSAVSDELFRRKCQAERDEKAIRAAKAHLAQEPKPKKKSRKPVVKDGSKPYCQIHNVNSHSTQDCRSRV